jgi:hypothetical protein
MEAKYDEYDRGGLAQVNVSRVKPDKDEGINLAEVQSFKSRRVTNNPYEKKSSKYKEEIKDYPKGKTHGLAQVSVAETEA